jgi:hypothetical protein
MRVSLVADAADKPLEPIACRSSKKRCAYHAEFVYWAPTMSDLNAALHQGAGSPSGNSVWRTEMRDIAHLI